MQEGSETTNTARSAGHTSSFLKDAMTPLSIIVAGIFIGAGLYFGGGQGAPTAPVTATGEGPQTLLDLALLAGVEEEAFKTCFDNRETLSQVQEDVDNAVATGGRGTPWAIMIGPTGKKYPINGAIPQQAIEQMIAIALAEGEGAPLDAETAQALENVAPVTEADHIKGNIDAKVMIIEYSDYDCPFCTRFHNTMNAIVAKYDPNDVAWVYRHFPIESLHPNATAVALASECVAKLGGNEAFWTFSDTYLK